MSYNVWLLRSIKLHKTVLSKVFCRLQTICFDCFVSTAVQFDFKHHVHKTVIRQVDMSFIPYMIYFCCAKRKLISERNFTHEKTIECLGF